MKILILFVHIITLMSSASQAQNCGQFDETWSRCTTSEDCIVDYNACGWLAAYNKASLQKIQKYFKCIGPMISCATPPRNQDKSAFKTICENKKCKFEKK